MEVNLMPGRYPAAVISYDPDTRTCRVDIPGITSNGDAYPTAEIEYPIGDKARQSDEHHSTELEILPNDTVWVAFIGGDPRYPIITGYRNPQAGNSIDWRRYHHANIEMTADNVLRLNAATVEINADTVTINGDTATINGNLGVYGDTLTHNDTSISNTHTHSDVQPGSGNTGAPN